MPGTRWKRSLKNPAMYESLVKKRGMSKAQAAAISNGRTPGRTVAEARKKKRKKRAS